MKSFIVALIIAASLVTGGLVYMNKLSEDAQGLSVINDSIHMALIDEDYEKAEALINTLKKEVDGFSTFFFATDNHTEIDYIKTALSELEAFTKTHMQADALSKVYVLSFYFSHLPENGEIRIENIL